MDLGQAGGAESHLIAEGPDRDGDRKMDVWTQAWLCEVKTVGW